MLEVSFRHCPCGYKWLQAFMWGVWLSGCLTVWTQNCWNGWNGWIPLEPVVEHPGGVLRPHLDSHTKILKNARKYPKYTCFVCISLESVPGLGEPPCEHVEYELDTGNTVRNQKETTEIPYWPAIPSIEGITGFRPSLPDPSSPGLSLIPMKCCTKQESKEIKV